VTAIGGASEPRRSHPEERVPLRDEGAQLSAVSKIKGPAQAGLFSLVDIARSTVTGRAREGHEFTRTLPKCASTDGRGPNCQPFFPNRHTANKNELGKGTSSLVPH